MFQTIRFKIYWSDLDDFSKIEFSGQRIKLLVTKKNTIFII